jgi:hypothetical protein
MEPYRILVTGSQDYTDDHTVWGALADVVRPIPPDREIVLVHGACTIRGELAGADLFADQWGRKYGVTVEQHPAQGHPTEHFGPWPRCGLLRSRHMVRLGAAVCLAFINPCRRPRCVRAAFHGSHGSSYCADLAQGSGIPVRRWGPVPPPAKTGFRGAHPQFTLYDEGL